MLLVWLLLVLSVGVLLKYATDSRGELGLFAFLLPRTEKVMDLPPPSSPKAPEKAPEKEVPAEPKPSVTPQEKMPSEWINLKKGKKAGRGSLGTPQLTILGNGDAEVSFQLTDAPGDYRSFHPTNVDSLAVDLMGTWGKGILKDERLGTGVLKRLQIADHKEWVRISGISRDANHSLQATVQYAPTKKTLRIVFSREEPASRAQ